MIISKSRTAVTGFDRRRLLPAAGAKPVNPASAVALNLQMSVLVFRSRSFCGEQEVSWSNLRVFSANCDTSRLSIEVVYNG